MSKQAITPDYILPLLCTSGIPVQLILVHFRLYWNFPK